MTKITENDMELLGQLDYQYIYASDIAYDGSQPERKNFEEVLLTGSLQNAIRRINAKRQIKRTCSNSNRAGKIKCFY